ncbi:DUF4157 domain-containing protein [Candidatus Poribacteria bacterium]|nr:DUF4157 domain-containing protein [Candidatus Poribacteria bacterium]
MQQRMNDKTVEVRQKQDAQFKVQIQENAEKSDVLTRGYNPLANITCKMGDKACAAKHVSTIHRTELFHPMNESQKVQSLLKLQQQYGNRFVQRVIAQHIQTKKQVEEEEELQTKARPGQASEVTPNLVTRINDIRDGGQPLPVSERAFFESRFGYDFSQVRLHTDNHAAQVAQSLKAQAFTVGRDVVFGAEQYAPKTDEGRRLMAHELTHVVQQGASGLQSTVKIQRRSWLFGAGEVRFEECSEQDLSDFAVIPEDGTTTFTPSNGVWHDTDGFWWRYHTPKTEWFKIPDDCEVDVTCTENGFSRSEDCTISTPGWTSIRHGSTNPF